MTVIHRNSLILRRHAKAMQEHAAQFRNAAAKGVIVEVPAIQMLGLAQALENIGNDLARTSEAVGTLETLLQAEDARG